MAGLDERCVAKAKELVFEKFPEMGDTKPSVSKGISPGGQLSGRTKQESPSTNPSSGHHSELAESQGGGSIQRTRYVVTFERDISLPGGGKMKRMVRVTMDEAGEILKLVSSK